MESRENQIVRLMQEGLDDGEVMEALIIGLKKTNLSSESKSIELGFSSKSETEDLNLKSLKYYSDKLGISYSDIAGALITYKRLGPYEYGLDAEDIVNIKKWEGNYRGDKSIYFGQLKDGKPNNFGIMVRANGIISEGSWKNGKREGISRVIRGDGSYFIGDIKNDNQYNGKEYEIDGTLYGIYKNGEWSSA